MISLLALITSACQAETDSAAEAQLTKEKSAREAWAKCLFELDKIEAIRGRNLDDLNKGIAVARNQFMVDCLNVEKAGPTLEQLSEMSQYAAESEKRASSDMSLNNGKR